MTSRSAFARLSAVNDDSTVKGFRFARVIVWLAWAFFVAAVIVLVMAFLLLLFNASPDAAFTRWVYRSTARLMEPFRGIFPAAPVGGTGSVFDFAILFAIVVYGMLGLAVQAVVGWLDGRIAERRWTLARDGMRRSPDDRTP